MKVLRNLPKPQKTLIITAIFIFLGLLIFSIIILLSRAGKVATVVRYAPTAATIKINNQTIPNNSTQYLKPGDYSVTVEFEHFDSLNTTVTISNNLHYLVGVLAANNEAGERYHNEHQDEFIRAEGLVSQYLNAIGELEKQRHPILKYLPINNSLYSISYKYGEDNVTPIIVVKTTTLYLDDAVSKLKTFEGIDLTSYQIIFNLDNPFSTDNLTITADTPLKVVQKTFSKVSFYSASKGQNISDNYYYISLYIDDYDRDYQYSHYRALLKKNSDGKWQLVATPQPLLTQFNTPNTPQEILDTVNSF